MYRYNFLYIFLSCIIFLSGAVLSQRQEKQWHKTNTMSRQEGEEHVPMRGRHSSTINIDDPKDASMREGSADGPVGDEPVQHGSGSGPGVDDEDQREVPQREVSQLEGSGFSSKGFNAKEEKVLSLCQSHRDQFNKRLDIQEGTGYLPRCTPEGLYEEVQCQQTMNECWCVDKEGNELSGTRTVGPAEPSCAPPREVIEVITARPLPIDGKVPSDNIDDDDDDYDIDISTTPMPSKASTSLFSNMGLLAATIGAAVFGVLCLVLLIVCCVHRIRKKDAGSYKLDDPMKKPLNNNGYMRASDKEFFL